MLVIDKQSDDRFVCSVSKFRKLRVKIANFLAAKLLMLQNTGNPVHHSLNLFPSGILSDIDRISPDIVNLHWIGGEMLSIEEIGRIVQPVVWTLHDMWAFCGAEHYDNPEQSGRYKSAYANNNRPKLDSGWDLNKWCMNRKRRAWSNSYFSVVTPSRWLSERVGESALLGGMSVNIIPNCIDHSVYRNHDSDFCRDLLSLPRKKILILFGAMASTSDPRKGYGFLKKAIKAIQVDFPAGQVELVVFGGGQGKIEEDTGLRTHHFGKVHDDATLVALYNAADIFVAPSLQDNLPNTLVESLACGTPCVAFRIGGMPELINLAEAGSLADEISVESLASAIKDLLSRPSEYDTIPGSILERDEGIVASKYLALYQDILH